MHGGTQADGQGIHRGRHRHRPRDLLSILCLRDSRLTAAREDRTKRHAHVHRAREGIGFRGRSAPGAVALPRAANGSGGPLDSLPGGLATGAASARHRFPQLPQAGGLGGGRGAFSAHWRSCASMPSRIRRGSLNAPIMPPMPDIISACGLLAFRLLALLQRHGVGIHFGQDRVAAGPGAAAAATSAGVCACCSFIFSSTWRSSTFFELQILRFDVAATCCTLRFCMIRPISWVICAQLSARSPGRSGSGSHHLQSREVRRQSLRERCARSSQPLRR